MDVLPEHLRPPIHAHKLAQLLEGYEDKDFVVKGLVYGFELGYEGPPSSTEGRNSRTVHQLPEQTREKVTSEIELGRIAGPFTTKPFSPYKCSPINIKEKSTPGKYRTLHDLSFPYDTNSVNKNIPDSAAKVTYPTIKHAVSIITPMTNPWLAKADLKDAYR